MPLARHRFHAKLAATIALIALAQWLFYEEWLGATVGAFALAWIAALVATRPDVRRSMTARIALVWAAAMAIVLVDDPSLLAWALFWGTLATAALAPRRAIDNAAAWAIRLLAHGVIGLAQPLRDLVRLARRSTPRRAGAIVRVAALPLIGGAIFLAIFASANPVLADIFARIRLPPLGSAVLHMLFWSIVLVTVWPSLRPAREVARHDIEPLAGFALPGLPLPTLLLSLVTFNAVFAVQNGLDIAFLWSGAPLPGRVTLADYAHRGAYTLIATALLAGLFVLVTLRPGEAVAQRPMIRRLVMLWVAQNVLLVASSILRTCDYVTAYGLTELRIGALAWMALVAIGLMLICWRLIAARSARWLINANALAALAVLVAASVVDLSAVAATWNVRHARVVGTAPGALDLCYLRTRGPSALLPLIELEQRAKGEALRDRVTFIRADILDEVERHQADWHGWTFRNARRLAAARTLLGPAAPAPRPAPFGRACDGAIIPPPPPPSPSPPPAPASPLTAETK